MRKYRHRQSGAIFETEMDMPSCDWEPLDDQKQEQDAKPEPPKRKRTRSKTAPKE